MRSSPRNTDALSCISLPIPTQIPTSNHESLPSGSASVPLSWINLPVKAPNLRASPTTIKGNESQTRQRPNQDTRHQSVQLPSIHSTIGPISILNSPSAYPSNHTGETCRLSPAKLPRCCSKVQIEASSTLTLAPLIRSFIDEP